MSPSSATLSSPPLIFYSETGKKAVSSEWTATYRLATGTNPFRMDFPLLSTGKGAAEGALGLLAGEEAGRFSFFSKYTL